MNRRLLLIVFVLVVATLVILGRSVWPLVAIMYHKQGVAIADRRMHAISVAEREGGEPDQKNMSKWYARRKHHCDRLADLGYLFHESYQMQNLSSRSQRDFMAFQQALLFKGMKTFPAAPYRYWGISANLGYFVIDVYDYPEFKSQWDTFASNNNDPKIADELADQADSNAGTADAGETSTSPTL